MKIELIKDHTVNGKLLKAGTTLDLNDETEKAWIKKGRAKSTRKEATVVSPSATAATSNEKK